MLQSNTPSNKLWKDASHGSPVTGLRFSPTLTDLPQVCSKTISHNELMKKLPLSLAKGSNSKLLKKFC